MKEDLRNRHLKCLSLNSLSMHWLDNHFAFVHVLKWTCWLRLNRFVQVHGIGSAVPSLSWSVQLEVCQSSAQSWATAHRTCTAAPTPYTWGGVWNFLGWCAALIGGAMGRLDKREKMSNPFFFLRYFQHSLFWSINIYKANYPGSTLNKWSNCAS